MKEEGLFWLRLGSSRNTHGVMSSYQTDRIMMDHFFHSCFCCFCYCCPPPTPSQSLSRWNKAGNCWKWSMDSFSHWDGAPYIQQHTLLFKRVQSHSELLLRELISSNPAQGTPPVITPHHCPHGRIESTETRRTTTMALTLAFAHLLTILLALGAVPALAQSPPPPPSPQGGPIAAQPEVIAVCYG